jgi:hypothetical protein
MSILVVFNGGFSCHFTLTKWGLWGRLLGETFIVQNMCTSNEAQSRKLDFLLEQGFIVNPVSDRWRVKSIGFTASTQYPSECEKIVLTFIDKSGSFILQYTIDDKGNHKQDKITFY